MVLLSACWADSVIESASSIHQETFFLKKNVCITQGGESKYGISRGPRISRPDPALDLDPNQALVKPN
jgi:hypothetical protein